MTQASTACGNSARDRLGCEMAAEVLRSSGNLCLRVSGLSMLPAVWPGDILNVSRLDANLALPGDIVLYGREGRLVAHRVVEVRKQKSDVRSPESEGRSRKAGFRIRDLGFRSRKPGASENRQAPIENRKSKIENAVSRIPCPVSRVEFVTRGDSLNSNDAPVSSHELLGRVTAIERGSRQFTPHQSVASRMASWIFRHSDFATRVVLGVRRWGLGIRMSYGGLRIADARVVTSKC